ncbi:MAG: alpha-mannosidase, partial [Eubacteriales bacterium]|nr:alpha-mannosidase [Eubacteriales bacterium]
MIEYQMMNPLLYGNLFAIRSKIYRIRARLEAEILPSAEPIPFDELQNSSFSPANGTVHYGRLHSCAWIRLKGHVPEDAVNPVLLLALNGEAQIYSPTGEILGAVTGVWSGGDVRRSAGWRLVDERSEFTAGANVSYLLDCGYNGFDFRDIGRGTFKGAFVAERDAEAYAYYYDYFTLLLLFSSTKDHARKRILRCVLHVSFARFARGDTIGARETLRPTLTEEGNSEFVYSAIGHGHLDLAWMWPMRETMRKAARTMSIALNHIDRYEGYKFGTSQPQQLQWIKDQHPALYERTKQAVEKGDVELQGGFWVECDCNMSSGESLIRQAIYGKRFMQEEFGKQMRMCWLPDAFGFNGNLPQILQGCGMEYFSTIKLTWNRIYQFPYRTFWWEGVDGTRVLVHMPPEGTYNSTAGPHALLQGVEKYTERALNTALLVFGSGDGGGGPKESHLELLKREHDLAGVPRVRFEHVTTFFDRLKEKEIEHVWKGELYLDVHQGTYTTQSETKRHNRLMERMLHELEALAALRADEIEYPYAELETLWKETLLYQFHDILPGSSIGRVYRESHARYAQMEAQLASLLQRYLPRGRAPSAVNLSPFMRREYVQYQEAWYTAEVSPYAAQKLKPYVETDDLFAQGNVL